MTIKKAAPPSCKAGKEKILMTINTANSKNEELT